MTGPTELTPQEAETVRGWLAEDVSAGKLTPAQMDAALRGEDTPSTAPASVHPSDIPAAPHIAAYRFPMYQAPNQGEDEARAADRELRGYLLEAGFDAARGAHFANAINRSAAETKGKSEVHNDLRGTRNFNRLEQLWGEGEFEKRAPAIKALIDRVEQKRPGFKILLQMTGAMDSTAVVSLLYTQAEIERERDEWKRQS